MAGALQRAGSVLLCVVAFIAAALPAHAGGVFSVKDYGAKGDGSTDDTAAIQQAIDAAALAGSAASVSVVDIPPGVYRVSIDGSTRSALKIRAYTMIRGAGNDQSVVKLADQQGNYFAIFSGRGRDVSYFTLDSVTVDSNASHNPVTSTADFFTNTNVRFSLVIYQGSHIRITTNHFTDIDDINTVSVNVNGSDIVVANNLFDQIGGSFDHDHSTVYVHANSAMRVWGNTIKGRGPGTPAARTAIETHGAGAYVQNNIIQDMYYGMNIAGVDNLTDSITITGNSIINCLTGIWLWSRSQAGASAALTNIVISRNKIVCDPNVWASVVSFNVARGIALWKDNNSPVNSLQIAGNSIRYNPLTRAGNANDRWASGIDLTLTNAGTAAPRYESIEILDNTIEGSLAAGVNLNYDFRTVTIARNTIVNPGQSQGLFPDRYRAGVVLEGKLSGVQVSSNVFVDNQKAPTMHYGVVAGPTAASSTDVSGNEVRMGTVPDVRLTRPGDGSFVRTGSAVELSATVDDAGRVGNVGFFDGSGVMGTVSSAPYTYTWQSITRGRHLLSAQATIRATSPGAVPYYAATPGAGDITTSQNVAADWLAARSDPVCLTASAVSDSNLEAAAIAPQPKVVNAANFGMGQPVSPGSLVSIFGADLGCADGQADGIPLPSEIANVSATFNGVAAPLIYVGSNATSGLSQINAQVPLSVLPRDSSAAAVDVVVVSNGVASPPSRVQVAAFSPGIFTLQGGAGQAAAITADFSALVAPPESVPGVPCQPAKPGDTIIIYATGLGSVDMLLPDGDVPRGGLARNTTLPTVLIGGVPARVDFAGLSPEFVGVNQLNVVVPDGVTPGPQVALQIQVGGVTTSDQVSIAVASSQLLTTGQ